MRLASVKPGDIVRVDGSLAFVLEVERRRLMISWVGRESNKRTISARSVQAHWRKASNGRAAAPTAPRAAARAQAGEQARAR